MTRTYVFIDDGVRYDYWGFDRCWKDPIKPGDLVAAVCPYQEPEHGEGLELFRLDDDGPALEQLKTMFRQQDLDMNCPIVVMEVKKIDPGLPI